MWLFESLTARVTSDFQVLLVSSSRHPDRWIVPGGGMEPEEEPGVAAVREVCEEVRREPCGRTAHPPQPVVPHFIPARCVNGLRGTERRCLAPATCLLDQRGSEVVTWWCLPGSLCKGRSW